MLLFLTTSTFPITPSTKEQLLKEIVHLIAHYTFTFYLFKLATKRLVISLGRVIADPTIHA